MEYVIYKISLLDNDSLCYIGSTRNFTIRKSTHKSACLRGYPIKLYTIINQNGGWKNACMTPLEKVLVKDKLEARIKEEKIRLEHNSTMNTNRAYLSDKDKKEETAIYNKKYVKENYSHLQTLWKAQYEKNKDSILASKAKVTSYKKAWRELCNMEL